MVSRLFVADNSELSPDGECGLGSELTAARSFARLAPSVREILSFLVFSLCCPSDQCDFARSIEKGPSTA